MRAVEVLPFVPVMWIEGYERWGSPSTSISAEILLTEGSSLVSPQRVASSASTSRSALSTSGSSGRAGTSACGAPPWVRRVRLPASMTARSGSRSVSASMIFSNGSRGSGWSFSCGRSLTGISLRRRREACGAGSRTADRHPGRGPAMACRAVPRAPEDTAGPGASLGPAPTGAPSRRRLRVDPNSRNAAKPAPRRHESGRQRKATCASGGFPDVKTPEGPGTSPVPGPSACAKRLTPPAASPAGTGCG